MKNTRASELRESIIERMKISSQKLIAHIKLLGQKVVVSENIKLFSLNFTLRQ